MEMENSAQDRTKFANSYAISVDVGSFDVVKFQ